MQRKLHGFCVISSWYFKDISEPLKLSGYHAEEHRNQGKPMDITHKTSCQIYVYASMTLQTREAMIMWKFCKMYVIHVFVCAYFQPAILPLVLLQSTVYSVSS